MRARAEATREQLKSRGEKLGMLFDSPMRAKYLIEVLVRGD
jgi:hypothetical protein